MQESSLGSPMDLLVIAVIFMLLFGGSKLAGLGKGIGESIKNFKTAVKDDDAQDTNKPTTKT